MSSYVYPYIADSDSKQSKDLALRVAKLVVEAAEVRMTERSLWREIRKQIKAFNIPAPSPPYFDENYFSDKKETINIKDETVGKCPSPYFDYEEM